MPPTPTGLSWPTGERDVAGHAPVGGWVVFGAGGHARSVVDVLERAGEVVVAVTGAPDTEPWHVDGLPDDRAAFDRIETEHLRGVVAIGANPARAAIIHELVARGLPAPPVVAATATVSPRCVLGAGTVVLEHAHVGPAARLAEGVIVNTGAIVEHDCRIGAGAHIAPGAALLGGAVVGGATLVGSGARVLPRVTVGTGATIGAGAVVTGHVADGETVVGVPAVTRRRRGGAT